MHFNEAHLGNYNIILKYTLILSIGQPVLYQAPYNLFFLIP